MQQQPIAIDGNTAVNIVTTLDGLNVALESMGKQPYDRVANIINEWKQQAMAQIQAMQTPPAAPEAKAEPEVVAAADTAVGGTD